MKTAAVLLTGSGRGAIACVLIQGPLASRFVQQAFRATCASAPKLHKNRICFGRWTWQDYEEEVVVCRTGNDRIEVQCHGGRLAARRLLNSLTALGAVELSLDQWLLDAEDDPFVRAAKAILPKANTQRTASILLDQIRGAMRAEITRVQGLLRQQAFSEVRDIVEKLQRSYTIGRHLVAPYSVVLVGPPNVGKSSLVNAVVGYQRSVVFDLPGTTRDLVSTLAVVDGWPVTFTDTAGIREAQNSIEVQGVLLAKETATNADLTLVVRDLTAPASLEIPPLDLAQSLVVGTKLDLVSDSVTVAEPPAVDIMTSSTTGEGIDGLIARIAAALVPAPPQPGAAVVLTQELQHALREINELVEAGDADHAIAATARLLAAK